MKGRYPLLAMATALLLEALAVVIARAEVVPAWSAVGNGLSRALVVLSLAVGLYAWVREVRHKGLTAGRGLAGGLWGLLLAAGAWLVFLLRSGDDFGVMSRRLVQSVDLEGTRGELYVYEYEGVPDGFEETVVMIRDGVLPVMRPLVTTHHRVGPLVQDGGVLLIRPESTNEDSDLHCNLTTKACW